MSYIMVDIEANGPIPGDYSMVEIGAVLVKEPLNKTFYGTLKPISDRVDMVALNAIGLAPDETLKFDDPYTTMINFEQWVQANNSGSRPIFVSDNNGFDFMFVHWYFIHFLGRDPFGYSSRNLGDMYKGLMQDVLVNFKHLRDTRHTHNPVDDAKGNAEAMLKLKNLFPKFNIKFN